MKILNFDISENAESEINKLTAGFSRPVEYADMAAIKIGGYGAVYYDNPERYIVFLSTELSCGDFETNVLYELNHIRQVEEKYPYTHLKRSDVVVKEKNPMFFSYLDHSIQSAVHDLDVMERLKKSGRSIDFYVSNRLSQILKIDLKSNMSDKYNYASFGVQFIMFCLTANQSDIEVAKDFLNKNFDSIADKIYPFAARVREIGFGSPLACAKSIMYIIDIFSLWDIEVVVFNEKSIKTHASYIKFIEENF
ncbi:hypothetical protein MUJ63_11985 [Lachnospiraceae bacterium NSJ-143]|nr:hypothetical protein [Lachnospiraceae bacterium NSJ-143]